MSFFFNKLEKQTTMNSLVLKKELIDHRNITNYKKK